MHIRYDLSFPEVLQFPFVSPYALRHLNEGDFFNRTLGAIELFPLLGPLVSLIEGVVATVINDIHDNRRLKQPGILNKSIGIIEVLPVIGSLVYRIDRVVQRKKIISRPLPIKDPEKWINDFKAAIQAQNTRSEIDLSLTDEKKAELTEVIRHLDKNRWNDSVPKNCNLLSQREDWVFTLKDMPEKVFKVPKNRRYKDRKTSVERRFETASNARKIIEKEGLNRLHVPRQELIEVTIDSEKIPVLIEECFNIMPGVEPQEALFQRCYQDPELKPFIRECVRQFILFIIRTGFADVRYDNNPLLSDGSGFGLIDLDQGLSPITGLRSGCSTGEDGILQYLPADEIEYFEPLLQNELSKEVFEKLNLAELKERLRKREKEEPNFKRYLAEKKVITSREPVDFTGYNPFADRSLADLEERINHMASSRLGLHLPTDRRFYLKNHFYPGVLNEYKRKGLIFDWQDFKEINPNSSGYFIWV